MYLEYWEFILPPLTLIVCLFLWFLKGRESRSDNTTIPFYDIPNELSPIEAGLLLDNDIDDHEIAAQIMYCINQGWLSIDYEENKTNSKIVKTDKADELPEDNDNKKLISSLFENRDSIPMYKLKKDNREPGDTICYYDFNNSVSKKLYEQGLYKQEPRAIKRKYNEIGWGLIFTAILIYFIGSVISFVPINPLALIISGGIVLPFQYFMSAKTEEGVKLKNSILGFKEYLEVAEKDRINFHSDPEKKPGSFSRLLPYAMVFEHEQEWSDIVSRKTDEEEALEDLML